MMWLALAFALDRVQLKIGERTYGARFNGIGCIDDVNARRAQAPMAYRVLLPWLIGLIERVIPGTRKYRLVALYEPFKVLSLTLLLALMAQVLGAMTALVFAVLVAATFYYDYWDWPFEVIAIVAGMSGDPLLTLGACILAAFSRETAILGALAYFCTTLDYYHAALLAIVVLCIQMAVRLYVGERQHYWHDNMVMVNRNDIRELFDNHPFYFGEIALAISGHVLLRLLGLALRGDSSRSRDERRSIVDAGRVHPGGAVQRDGDPGCAGLFLRHAGLLSCRPAHHRGVVYSDGSPAVRRRAATLLARQHGHGQPERHPGVIRQPSVLFRRDRPGDNHHPGDARLDHQWSIRSGVAGGYSRCPGLVDARPRVRDQGIGILSGIRGPRDPDVHLSSGGSV